MIILLRIAAPIVTLPFFGGAAAIFITRSIDLAIKTFRKQNILGNRPAKIDDYLFAVMWIGMVVPLSIVCICICCAALSFAFLGYVWGLK